ncbi:MAG: nucleotidyltransferase [Gammaproteobacteria bacterium]
MTIDTCAYTRFLEQVASDLDIPPSKYKQAVERYQSVGAWLERGTYPGAAGIPIICPQGSFRLGTVTRPIRNGIEAAYDIDLVCELLIAMAATDPKSVKYLVGNRLRENETYARLLDEEGRRCWTLEYAEQDGVGFHLDVLPAVPNRRGTLDTSIAITHKRDTAYSWSASNPRGYGVWFDGRNAGAFNLAAASQKVALRSNYPELFARVDDVPDQLVRTPLQRVIQILKRHRDMRFNQRQRILHAPISVIITTLAAHLYRNEPDAFSALNSILTQLRAFSRLVDAAPNRLVLDSNALIQRKADGTWHIGNPSNPGENFADRWHEDNHARARAFFLWVEAAYEDLVQIVTEPNRIMIKDRLSRALHATPVLKHISIIAPVAAAPAIPRVEIASKPKPWRAE